VGAASALSDPSPASALRAQADNMRSTPGPSPAGSAHVETHVADTPPAEHVIGGLHTTPPSAEAAGPALHGVAQASFVDALEAQGHGAAGAAVCSLRSDDGAAGANAASLASLLRQFRLRIEDPLLPLPDPKVVRRRLFHVS
jgi:hypothetical protein